MKITRRDLLKIGGGAGVAVALGGGFWKWSEFPLPEPTNLPGVEKWIPSVCGQCPGGCGILGRVIDGWVVNIVGNPLHPINRGSLCPKGIAGLQGLYDPDRIRTPLKRVGKRGEGKWQPITWEEALSSLSSSLKRLRQTSQPERLALWTGGQRGLIRSLWKRFLEAFGSPNAMEDEFQWEGLPIEGLYLTQGIYAPPAYDLENARYVLSFGPSLLESFWSPVQALHAYGHFRRGRPDQRGKWVQIEPRLSITGMKADEWIPAPPGSEADIALAIAGMIIKEGLYDKEFVAQHCVGFENWVDAKGKEHMGFKDFVLSSYGVDAVSKRTGISVDTLIRLAREFSSNIPSLAIAYRDRPFHQMAVAILNGLVGSIDVPGGLLVPRAVPLQALPEFAKDPIAQKGARAARIAGTQRPSSMPQDPYRFAKNVIAGKPYRPEVLFVDDSNPLFSNPCPDLFQKAFAFIPLVVSFSPYMDDTTLMADLVLPDHTPLERWQDEPVFSNRGFPVLGIRQPVVQPLYQTQATGDVILQLAKRLGGEVAKAFPWQDFKEVLLYGIRGVFDARRGDTFGLQFEQSWTRLLQRGGWWAPSYKTFEEFWQQLQEKGGWWDPLYDFKEWHRVFATPSKKFQFYAVPTETGSLGTSPSQTPSSPIFPHWEEPGSGTDEKVYPFRLHIFKTLALSESQDANQPWLQSISGAYLFEKWETWVEINPETAKRLGIDDREWVWVESEKGKIKVRARHYKGIMPHVVAIPFGLGHRSAGRWADGLGENPYHLVGEVLDPLTAYPIVGSTRVKIYKA